MLIAATLPLAAIVAEDAGKTKTTDQKQGQSSAMMGMKCMMGKGQMMSNWKEQDAELDKLVAEMNSASADKKLDAGAAVVNVSSCPGLYGSSRAEEFFVLIHGSWPAGWAWQAVVRNLLRNRLRRGCARRPESSPARQRPEPTAQKSSHGASHHCNLDPFHWQELRPVEIHFFGCLNQGPIQTR